MASPPVFRSQILRFDIGGRRQSLEHIGQVGHRLYAAAPAPLQDRVDHRAGLASLRTSLEQPVLRPEFTEAGRLVDQVVVNTGLPVVDVGDELAPLGVPWRTATETYHE